MIPYPGLVTAIIIVLIATLPASLTSQIIDNMCPTHFASACKAADLEQKQ